MVRSMFVYAFIASQLAVVAAFLTTPPAATPHFLGRGASSKCSLGPSYELANRRRVSLFEQPVGATPPRPRQNIAAARFCPSHHSQQARHGGDDEQQGPSNETAISGLSELELRRKHDNKRNKKTLLATRRRRSPAQQPTGARFAALTASALAAGLAVAVFAPEPVTAAVKAAAASATATAGSEEVHLHVGQKVANFFRRGGLPDWATLMTISAMPVVELRGGVPVGIWMGMPIAKVFGLCVAGNMIPIPIILLALRSAFVQKLAKPILDRAREKAAGFGDEKSQALALTLFVGIPLPGTGAWTGAMGAFLLGMPFQKAMLSIFLGVVSAGMIMSCLTLAGKAGALLATAILAVFCVSSILRKGGEATKASDFSSK